MTTCWISDRQGKGDQRQSIGNGTRFQQAVCSSSSSAVAHAAGTADQTCRRHRQHPSVELQMQNQEMRLINIFIFSDRAL